MMVNGCSVRWVSGGVSGLAWLGWAAVSDVWVGVRVDGRFYDVVSGADGGCWLWLDGAVGHVVEVSVVDGFAFGGGDVLVLGRDVGLPTDAVVEVSVGETVVASRPMWGGGDGRDGFGGLMGYGEFGWDNSSGLGFGVGELGGGGFGSDGRFWRWGVGGMDVGGDGVTVRAVDGDGVLVAAMGETVGLGVTGVLPVARGLGVEEGPAGVMLRWD